MCGCNVICSHLLCNIPLFTEYLLFSLLIETHKARIVIRNALFYGNARVSTLLVSVCVFENGPMIDLQWKRV